MRKLITTSLCFVLCFPLLAQQDPFFLDEKSSESILTRADQMPYFFGCESFEDNTEVKRKCSDLEMVRFISRYLVYPEEAKNESIEGTVYVSFIVDENGVVNTPSILMDIGGGCGQAALEVLKEMPPWQPAIHNENPTKVKMNLPIQFFLRAEGRDEAERYSLSWGTLTDRKITKKQLLENLSKELYVRGPEGGKRILNQLEFIYQKENKYLNASSRGEISEDLKKLVGKIKKDGNFTVNASIQDDGKFVTVSRNFRIIK